MKKLGTDSPSWWRCWELTHQADEDVGGGSEGLNSIGVQAEGQKAPKGVDNPLDDPKVEQHADHCIEEQQDGHSLKKTTLQLTTVESSHF